MIEFVDKTLTQVGTPINRANLMAMQGFIGNTITFEDGKIIETNANGDTMTVTFNSDGSITETFVGKSGKTLTKTTTFNSDGSISEAVILA